MAGTDDTGGISMSTAPIARLADERRLDVVKMDYHAHTGHIGGAMSCAEILCTLYYGIMDIQKIKNRAPDRDRFILSKGHCAEMLYAVLCDCGFFPKAELESYAAFHTKLAEHPTKKVNGVEIATGALGHGASAGTGMALALKMDKIPAHVYVLMGDGEQAEGSVWEAAMAAAKYKLDNLTYIIDRNRLQISGNTEDVMPLDKLSEKYAAFGFEVTECNGHSVSELKKALSFRSEGKPVAVIANTVKGKGISYMENKAEWHHTVPTKEQAAIAEQEITKRLEVSAYER